MNNPKINKRGQSFYIKMISNFDKLAGFELKCVIDLEREGGREMGLMVSLPSSSSLIQPIVSQPSDRF